MKYPIVLRMPQLKRTDDDVARGRRFRDAYQRIGLSRQEVAEKLGLIYHHVTRIEKGQRVGPDLLTRMAELCSVTERWLVRGPSYSPQFEQWLATQAPADLHDAERELLACVYFPPEHHPGPRWYSTALEAWRLGTGDSLLQQTHVRRKQAS